MDKKKIKALLIDDEAEALQTLKVLLGNFEEIEVAGEALNVDDGLAILLNTPVDIVFLDIHMPEKNGFELIHELQKYHLSPAIIFITAYDRFAIEAIKHSAFDYLLKPIDPVELLKSIRRYQSLHDPERAKRDIEALSRAGSARKLRFATRTGSIFIHPDEIIYIQAEGNYSEIYLAGDRREMVTMYLKDIYEQLPQPGFHRLGRSVVINTRYLKMVDRKKKVCVMEAEGKVLILTIPNKYLQELEKLA